MIRCAIGGHPWQNQPYCTQTNHIVHKIVFEMRQPLRSMGFEVSSLFGDMSQNVRGSPILKFFSKRNETLLRTLHAEVRILAIYAKYVAPPTKSMSSMAAKMLE